jgi:phytoene dehydrogenase-like protein
MSRLPELASLDPALFSALGVDEPLVATVAIAPSVDEMEEIARLRDRGRIADRPMMLLNVPSVLDPSMKTPDGHVLSLEVLFTPYALEGGWDESVPQRWLDVFGSIAGDGWRESLLRHRAMTPLDYERDLGLTRGNPPAYPGDAVDVLLGRRGALTTYATPWRALYLSGAGTYPGGGVWGAAGRNTALRVLRDLA